MSKARAKKPVIRASEIGSYVYCRRAWWLKRTAGFEPAGKEEIFARGIAAHAGHGRLVRRTSWQRRAALVLLALGVVLLLFAAFSFGII
ncbi:MAG: hypothetical protein J0I20_02195 [Chloroflexi bacterium]|nr:hypothetical protein [Chloroflexota bacterium]OJV89418.1 MAG: hypothetical protein BGO39_36180 [Chloroflexi bacterium 54-19]